MPEVTISLDGHDEELAVFGSRDQYLRQVRDALGVKVLARHGEVRVEGERRPGRAGPAGLRGAAVAVPAPADAIASGDVADLIETARRAGEPRPARRRSRSARGTGVVRPRTDGQARYLQALRDNELVFCIGPAGTGKTYLAVADGRRGAAAGARSRRSSWSGRPSRPASTSASCPATSRRRSTRTCARCSTPCTT